MGRALFDRQPGQIHTELMAVRSKVAGPLGSGPGWTIILPEGKEAGKYSLQSGEIVS